MCVDLRSSFVCGDKESGEEECYNKDIDGFVDAKGKRR